MEPITSSLYLIFTPALCSSDPWITLRAALMAGVDLVQWRVKTRVEDGLAQCRDLCGEFGVPLILNDRPDLVCRYDLAGAHIGQDDISAAEARRALGPDRWLGISTHNPEQILRAQAAGADNLGYGPVFPTQTKDYTEGQGPENLALALGTTELPIFAIGGITEETLPSLVAVGCRRIAVSSAILQADDPSHTTAALRAALLA